MSNPNRAQAGVIHVRNLRRSQAQFRKTRESYVPQRLPRMLREEGVLMLAFDSAKTIEEKLKILDGLLRVRRMMLDVLGWPKPPTMRGNFMPQAVDGERNHDPMSDLDVSAVPVPPPSEGEKGSNDDQSQEDVTPGGGA